MEQKVGGGFGVVAGAVGVWQRDLQCPTQLAEAVTELPWQQNCRQLVGVDHGCIDLDAGSAQEGDIKSGAVGDDGVGAPADEGQDFGSQRLDWGCIGHVGRTDAGKLLNARRDGAAGVDKGGESLTRAACLKSDRAELDDPVPLGTEPGCLKVKSDERARGHLSASHVCSTFPSTKEMSAAFLVTLPV